MKSSLRPLGLIALFSLCVCCFASQAWSVSPPAINEGTAARPSGNVSGPPAPMTEVLIPGPLRSFLRMAGISSKATADEALPLLANEINLRGYFHGRPTEFLVLLMRYLQQARELVNLAGPDRVIKVTNCEDAKPLLAVLGYRWRHSCGAETTVQTAESQRAFLTIDSGFPLSDLEEALRSGKPFTLQYPSTQVPLLFATSDWAPSNNTSQDVIDTLLHNPALARLYAALSRVDPETAIFLRQSPGLRKLAPYAAVFDFYGSHIYVRSGKVVVPGGAAAE